MKINTLYKITLLLIVAAFAVSPANAQKKKIRTIELTGKVINPQGAPIKDVSLISGEGAVRVYTDAMGEYKLKTKMTSSVVIEAEGYETIIINLAEEVMPAVLQLEKTDIFASRSDLLHRMDGEDMYRRDLVGAVSTINMDQVRRYPDLSLTNSLQGLAAGLIARAGGDRFGRNTSTLFVRGQHGYGNSAAIIVVDGIERSIDDILAEEIESIEVLKDATAKVLYGPRATNGVVLITTKRGEEGRRLVRANVEYGVMMNTRTPEFLDSYNYARLYNEARLNDGYAPRYSDSQLEGYRNSKGVNDPLYPNIDWYDHFLRNISPFRKVAVEYYGGNKIARYALVAGYMGGDGLEKVGKRTSNNQFNLRGNLDIRINDVISVRADVAAKLHASNRSIRTAKEMMTALSTNKPNEYPLTIDSETLGLVPNDNGVPYFGGSDRVNDNLYADLGYNGKMQERYVTSQTNLGVDFNFNKFVKGLGAEAYLTFDDYSQLNQKLETTYPTYSIGQYLDQAGETKTVITQLKKENQNTNQTVEWSPTQRIIGWRGNINYKANIQEHNIGAVAAVRYFKYEFTGANQDLKNINYTLRLNYDYDKKYFFELAMGYMSSNMYTGSKNNYFFSPTAGLAWIISKENFMSSVSWLDFLKLKASAGILGYDGNATAETYDYRWTENSTKWQSGETNNTVLYTMNFNNVGNPSLKWETSKELNVGLEGMFLSNRLRAEVNYFATCRENIIRRNSNYSAALGDFTWLENVAEVTNQGVDAHVSWGETLKNGFTYRAGVNFTSTKNKVIKVDETPGVEGYRSQIGKRTDAIIPYRYAGLFGRDVDIAKHPHQTFGTYIAGDIAYRDLNGDGIIDGRDQEQIGHTFPSTTWGIDAEFKYKGFGLYILGTAETGVTKLLTNSYYRNLGENSYSVLALDRYHPVNNPQGTRPRLTTSESSDNSFRNSEYWYEDASFFRLKNVELSYTFFDKTGNSFYSSLKLFVRCANVFVISPIKDLDPERVVAGVENYPAYRTLTGGISLTF